MNQRTYEIFKDGIHPRREEKKKNWLIPVIILIILIVSSAAIIFIFTSSKEKVTGLQTLDTPKQEIPIYDQQEQTPEPLPITEPSEIQEKPPIETETTAKLGILEISISNITQGIYTEWDIETLLKTNKTYYRIYVKLFNPTWETTETIDSIKLIDELDNKHLPDINPNKFIPLKELGKDWQIYPKITREGYLFFTEINENSKKFDLIFEINAEDEIKRAIYSFEMIR